MNKITTLILMLFVCSLGYSQRQQQDQALSTNSGETLLNSLQSKGFTLGGYGQIDYNEPDGSAPGKIDVHRLVLLFAYKFNDKVSFLTEIEYEHVKEVYVEQAYLRYQMAPSVNFVAGLMLVPMGIINEFHEPTTYELKTLDPKNGANPLICKDCLIFSGGPLDAIQPHRLEMGSRLKTRRGKTLYDFWRDLPTRALNEAAEAVGTDILVNCASQEYFGAVDRAKLKLRVIEPQFYEMRGGVPKIVSFFAKKARGSMARFIVERRITDVEGLKDFDFGGYRFQPGLLGSRHCEHGIFGHQ